MELPNWLYQYRTNVMSQHGEDGVVKQIIDKIGIENKWIVDIGAGDGVFISNSWYWLNEESWHGVCVEADSANYQKLQSLYSKRKDVFTFNKYVSDEEIVDKILSNTPAPKSFDILSIDIDSVDYKIWEMMEEFNPRVVIIEANASMAPDIEVIQEDSRYRIGSSSLSMVKLAKRKGYELAAHLVSNCIFVRNDEFQKLGLGDNSLDRLFISPFVPKVFSDMNGVHYIIKEGPWGVGECKMANDLSDEIRTHEDGYRSIERSIQMLNDENILVTNKSGIHGHTSQIEFNWDIKTVLDTFKNRMSVFNIT